MSRLSGQRRRRGLGRRFGSTTAPQCARSLWCSTTRVGCPQYRHIFCKRRTKGAIYAQEGLGEEGPERLEVGAELVGVGGGVDVERLAFHPEHQFERLATASRKGNRPLADG